MPAATYEELLTDTLPTRIDNDTQYDALRARFGGLLGQRRRSRAEEKLMDLLSVLLEDYDRRHGLPPDESTPAEKLQFLLDHSGRTPADLLAIFGQRSHVNEALTGKRPISAEQARRLGKLFSVQAGLFI